MSWEEYPNVATIGDITIVGEAHGFDASERLVESVLDDRHPSGIGLEVNRLGLELLSEDDAGLTAGRDWARNCDAMMACLDEREATLRAALPVGVKMENVQRVANRPQDAVTESGRMPFEAALEARQQVMEQFGPTTFRLIYPHREEQMARRLIALDEKVNGNVVAVVGAFHVPWLEDEVKERDSGYVENERVQIPI